MNDRTLMELAAKAAGYTVRWDDEHDCFYHVEPKYPVSQIDYGGGYYAWMPLDDDGDALRLADRLNMAVYFSASGKTAEAPDGPGPVWEETDYRRAIVRAAAEIGSQMK